MINVKTNIPPGLGLTRIKQRLRQEHRQGLSWRKQPLTVFGKQRFDLVQQPRARQRVEQAEGVCALGVGKDSALLPSGVGLATVHYGRLSDGRNGFVALTLPSLAGLLDYFQRVAERVSLKLVPFGSDPFSATPFLELFSGPVHGAY